MGVENKEQKTEWRSPQYNKKLNGASIWQTAVLSLAGDSKLTYYQKLSSRPESAVADGVEGPAFLPDDLGLSPFPTLIPNP